MTRYGPARNMTTSPWDEAEMLAGAGSLALLVLVVLVALALSFVHGPTQTASNETAPPAATRMMPIAPPSTTPRPLNPVNPGLAPPPAPRTNTQPQ